MKNVSPDDKDLLAWKWSGDAGTMMISDFGDPTRTTGYQLCLYDTPSGVPQLEWSAAAPAGGTCARKPCWSVRATGFKYRDPDLTPNGIARLVLKAGRGGAAQIGVKGQGPNLALPTLPFSAPVTVQLRATTGQCWTASYSTPKANGATRFIGQGRRRHGGGLAHRKDDLRRSA